MSSVPPRRSESGDGFLLGKLLIALPGMPDPRFEKSVIFMCAHSEEGAMGLIVNKPFEGLGFRDLVARLDLPVTEVTPDPPVLFGGPVGTGQGFVLHSSEYASNESTLSVTSEISLTATLDILRAHRRGPRTAQSSVRTRLRRLGTGPDRIRAAVQWLDPFRGRERDPVRYGPRREMARRP